MNRSLRKFFHVKTPGIVAVGLSLLPSVSPLNAEAAQRARYYQSAYDESDEGPTLGPPTLGPQTLGPSTIEGNDDADAAPMAPPTPPRMLQAPTPSPAQAAVNAKRRTQVPARTPSRGSTQSPGGAQYPGDMQPSGANQYPGSTQNPNSSRTKTPARTQSSTRSKIRGQTQTPARMQSKASPQSAPTFEPPVPSRPPLRSDTPARRPSTVRAQPPVEAEAPSTYAPPEYGAPPKIAEDYNDIPTVEDEPPRAQPQTSAPQNTASQRTAPHANTNWMQSRQSNSRPTSTQQLSTPQPSPRQPMSAPTSRPISTLPMAAQDVDSSTQEVGPNMGEAYNEIPTAEPDDTTIETVESTPSQPAPRTVQPTRNQYRPAPTPKRSLNPLSGKFLRQSAEVAYEEPTAVESEPAIENSTEGRKRWRWNPFAKPETPAQLETPESSQGRVGRFPMRGAAPLEEAPLYTGPESEGPAFEEYSPGTVATAPQQAPAEQPKGWRWPWSAK
jgi:hypothetical protein